MKNALIALFGIFALQSSAFALEPCLVHPSGGDPVVYVGKNRVEKVWDLDAAHALVNDLISQGVCQLDTCALPTCSVKPNQSLWSVYLGKEFWQNFASDDVAGAAAFAQQLRDYQFCN